MTSNALLSDLQAENARLIALLEANNNDWKFLQKQAGLNDNETQLRS
jgi:hypothetical protein